MTWLLDLIKRFLATANKREVKATIFRWRFGKPKKDGGRHEKRD